jgi:hypothetical protein
VFALFFTGKTIPTDNGYLVYAIPKSQKTRQEMGDFVNQIMMMLQIYSHGMVSSNWFPPNSPQN